MMQPSRTTESLSRDNEAIREIMHQIRDRLTVPDRATLAVGLVGHLATLMNGRQIEKLMGELQEEARLVQDVPPTRRRDRDQGERSGATGSGRSDEDARLASDRGAVGPGRGAVGQAGRGPVTERRGTML